MKIFVVGNINSGKSFVVNKLSLIFPKYKVLSIDEYRTKYSDGSVEKELKTRALFAKDVMEHHDAIIEFSGGKNLSSLFVDNIRINSFIVIEVYEKPEICVQRIESKDFSKTPYPKFDESLVETIYRLDQEFENESIKENFQDKYLIKYRISSSNTLDDLPLKQYENAVKIADSFIGKCDCLVAYGSLGRQEMSRNSDIDLFLISSLNISIVENELRSLFPEADFLLQDNQIDVFYDNQLTELTVVPNLETIQLYYVKSEIKNIEKTLLLGYEECKSKLIELVQKYRYSFLEEFDFTLARLEYYTRSLERIIKKNDLYKYFFHTNIIIHEYIKLKYFIGGNREYSYLPKNALNYLEISKFQSLNYKIGDNQKKHREVVLLLVDEIINEANCYRRSVENESL